MFENNVVNLKCSFPRDYNDPYELFLSIDPENVELQYVAYYQEILADIPQHPTTCFSKSPNVIPMWAHYARDHSGYVIEVYEDVLKYNFPEATIQDMAYSEKTGEVNLGSVAYAYATGKPRHTYRVMTQAFNAAYFTKNKCWEYELERRVVVREININQYGEIMLLQLPVEAISSIIAGPRASDLLKQKCKDYASSIGCKFHHMVIGKSSCVPYFTDEHEVINVFDGNEIVSPLNKCSICKEPIYSNNPIEKCHWCSVDERLKDYASYKNPIRMLSNLGMLEEYINMARSSKTK